MPNPLYETDNVLALDPSLSKMEFLPIPNIVADFQLNANTDILKRDTRTFWREVVGLLRLDGLHKTYRAGAAAKPADGQITLVGPNRIQDGEQFFISDGTTPVIFEFDVTGDGVSGGTVAIDISAATSIDDVRDAVMTAINGSALNITAEPTHTLPAAVGGGGTGPSLDLFNTTTTHANLLSQVAQNASIIDLVDDEGFTHRGMSGARINSAIGEIFPVASADILDGETFTIPARGANPQEVYEFDKTGAVEGGRFAVDISTPTTAAGVASAIASSITTNGTDITAVVNPYYAKGFITALSPDKLLDGETFTLDDGYNTPTIFEFDKTGDGVTGGNVAIDISSAASMQDVRSAILVAIAGAGISYAASNPGFGDRIVLTNGLNDVLTNVGDIVHTVAHQDFLTGPIEGYRACVLVFNDTAGAAYNATLTDTVADEGFTTSGMSGGVDAGWDISSGRCILEGYDILFDDIPRQTPLVGTQQYLMVHVQERRLTQESDPTEVQVAIPGVVGTLYGANLYRWSASIGIEAFDADPPSTVDDETNVALGALAEFDSTNGQTIVSGSEVPIRVTKFNQFLEPQDVSTKVSKTGDTMSGTLEVTIGSGGDAGIEATGGPTDGRGGTFVGQGTAVGVHGSSHATTGSAGVEGVGGDVGVKGSTLLASSIGVLGQADQGPNGTGVKGLGTQGLDFSTGGPGMHAAGGMGILIEKTSIYYPHIRITAHGDSGTPPTNVAKGDLWVPSTGTANGQLYIYNGTAWETVRAPTLGKVGDVHDAASYDKEILRYSGSNSRWERVSSLLQEVMYFSPKDAIISITNATLGDFAIEITRGEISVAATGTSSGATLEMTWVVPMPPGWEEWGASTVPVIVVPANPSTTSVAREIEVYDADQSVDHNPGQTTFGSTGWQDVVVNDDDLSGNYRNFSNNQGNMMVKAIFSFGNTETIAVGGLYIKSRGQNAFGPMPYPDT